MAPRCCWLLGALVLAGAQLSQIERSQASWRPESSSSSKSNLEDLTRSAESASAEQPANNEKPFASMVNSAVINGTVNLACDISPASADDSVALILWYKDDSLAPIYTIDARKVSTLDKAKTSIEEAYATRASFNVRSKPAQLHLEPVRPSDEGEYRCRVDFKRGRTVNTIISLRVIQLPDELRIVQAQRPQTKLEGLIGPFSEGSELVLVCLAVGGKPRPQIRWRRDFNVIDESYQHIDKEGTSNELRISSLSKNHLLSMFTCQATNNNITVPMQTSITLDLNLKPQEVHIRLLQPHQQPDRLQGSPDEPLLAGQTVTFECITHGSRPQAAIHWLFQGSRHEPPMQVDQQQTSSRLSVTLQRSFNQAPLVCVAENPRIAGPASSIKQSIKLDVHYPPQLSVRLDSSLGALGQQLSSSARPDQAQEGNDIYLTCSLEANPRPVKPILWRFNGRPLQALAQLTASGLPEQAAPMIVMSNQSLVLRKVNRNQAGAYSCEASNQHGSNSSRPLEVDIRHAPVCVSDDILVFQVALGQTVNIDCQVQANPSTRSLHYSWFSASANEANLTHWLQRDVGLDEQIDESSSRLKYRIKDEHALGLLKCKAKNEVGLQQRACLFRLELAPLPSLRHTCSLAARSATSLQVACQPSDHLKSEEFELLGASSPAPLASRSPALNNWLDLEAIRSRPLLNGNPLGSPDQGNLANQQSAARQRLVYPPGWLLAELHKWQAHLQAYDLSAYVIVASPQQLANIKSIVEENRLFSTNPRPVYYVMTKQLDAGQKAPSQQPDASGDLPSAGRRPFGSPAPPADKWLTVEDPAVQLASSFVFSVPNLEPNGQKYKLIIYGQNLANRTRDWLVVSGETGNLDTGDPLPVAHTAVDEPSNRSLQQKSIVMRSDDSASHESSNQQQHQQLRHEQDEQQVDRLTGLAGSGSLVDRLHQLNLYKDYAISYAKQRPLLAIPLGLSSLLVLVLLLTWAANTLVQLIRGPTRARRRLIPSAGERQSDVDRLQVQPTAGAKFLEASQEKSQFLALGSPETNPDEHSYATSTSSGCVVNQQTIEEPMHNVAESPSTKLRASVYTIEEPYGQPLAKLHAAGALGHQFIASTILPNDCHILGSLDRRLLHNAGHQEPIYLSETGALCFHQQASSAGVRANELLHGPCLYSSMDRHLSHMHQTPNPDYLLEANLRPFPSQCNNGSFSSSTGSEMANQQARYRSHQAGKARSQRVAFDLSSEQDRRHLANNLADSGASNSATNTADSGLESPPTAADLSSQASFIRGAVSACPAHANQCRGNPRAGSAHDQQGVLMLMELSPGSQESSTLMQTSVDSLSASNACSTVRQLNTNHHMATSFVGRPMLIGPSSTSSPQHYNDGRK